jgi:hypothetical protein
VRRGAWLAGAALVGAVAIVTIFATRDPSSSPRRQPTRPSTTPTTAATPPAAEPTLLVWTSGGLPAGFAEGVAAVDGVERVTSVTGDVVDLVATFDSAGRPVDTPPPGLGFPLDAFGIDLGTYPAFVDESAGATLAGLQPGEAVLGSTSSRLRRLGPGGVLELAGGARLTVAAVVDDASVGAAELVVRSDGADALGIRTPRFLLVAYRGERSTIERAIASIAPDRPVRVRAPEETPYLRHGDLVLPQAVIKAQFGEFAYRRGPDRFFEQDPAWAAGHIATTSVPILGTISCHRDVLDAIAGALRELEQQGLGSLVDPAGYAGCFVPTEIPGGGISRHSWGVAIDLNFVENPGGLASFADPELIAVMERFGFISGAKFLAVDPGHFEYVRPPEMPSRLVP